MNHSRVNEVTKLDYIQWVRLFGRAADDKQVRDAVTNAGITKKLKIGRDELSVSADIKGEGMTITFTDETILRPEAGGVLGRPILSGVLMIMQRPSMTNLYRGPLPFELNGSDSQAKLRVRFGTPMKSSDTHRWDAWLIEGLMVTVTYTEDLQSLNRIAVSLPRR